MTTKEVEKASLDELETWIFTHLMIPVFKICAPDLPTDQFLSRLDSWKWYSSTCVLDTLQAMRVAEWDMYITSQKNGIEVEFYRQESPEIGLIGGSWLSDRLDEAIYRAALLALLDAKEIS